MDNDTQDSFENEFNLQIQKKFISLLIFDKAWAEINGLDIVKPELFENNTLKNICSWIHKHYKKYKTYPTRTILAKEAEEYVNKKKLKTGEYYLYEEAINEIFNLNDIANLEYYKEKAVEYLRRISWKKALVLAGSALSMPNYELALEKFKEVLSYGSENDLGIDLSKLDTDQFYALVNETYDKTNMLQTGIPTWDDALGGGFVRNNLHLIAGAPGAGKSRTMAFLAKQALTKRKRVVFITLELTEAEIITLLYSSVTNMSQYDLMDEKNRKEFEEKREMFTEKYGDQFCVKFYRPNTITTNTIHNYIQKLIDKKTKDLEQPWQPDVIFVDYLDKLLPTTKIKGNIYEDNGQVGTDCKNLAITFKCPVVSGAQLGRIGWTLTGDSVISMDSIAESAQKVHIAHSMTTLNANVAEKAQMKERMYIAKSRSGKPNTIIWCNNDLARCNIIESEPWDPKQLETEFGVTIKSASVSTK